MAQVNRKGDKPVASPALEAAIRRRRAADRPPAAADRPPLSTFPGRPIPKIPGQLTLDERP